MKKIKVKDHVARNYFSKCILNLQLSFRNWRLRMIVENQLTYFILIFVLISGCGYSTKSLISRNISSIYIPVFENKTFRRSLEFELTKTVKDEIMTKTNLRIVQKDSADTILYGTINNVTESVLTQNNRDNIVESRVAIYVDIKLVDRRTDRVLMSENGLRKSAEFIVQRGENVASAGNEALVSLAETIVDHLEEKW